MAANPKTIALCIFLFLASALITLSLKSTTSHHRTSPNTWLPSIRPGKGSGSKSPSSIQAPKVAFATFLAGNANPDANPNDDNDDGYFLGTRVLAYQLLHSRSAGTNSSIPFLVVCTKDVTKRKRDKLRKEGATVIVVDKLQADWVHPGVERWKDVLSKLRLWQLTQYSKICFIDADTLVTKPLDNVFLDESTLTSATLTQESQIHEDEAALPRTYMFATHADFWGYDHPYPPDTSSTYLNCGFFVFTPSKVMFDYYVSLLRAPGKFDSGFPEQNLLNYAHRREGNMPWKVLWYGWNVNWPTENDWRGTSRPPSTLRDRVGDYLFDVCG